MIWITRATVCKVLVWLELFPPPLPEEPGSEPGLIHLLKLTFIKSM